MKNVKLIGKFGLDGSGAHKVRHQIINSNSANIETPYIDQTKSKSFLLMCYCPITLSCDAGILWTNPVPNSTAFTRPVSLVRTNEDREVISVELEPHLYILKKEFPILMDNGTTV